MKISRNGKYFAAPSFVDKYFGSDLDVSQGSSGGPVLNMTTGTIEGLVHAGPSSDYTIDNSNPFLPCLRASICPGDKCANGNRGIFQRTRNMSASVPSLSPRDFKKETLTLAPTSAPVAGDFNGDGITDVLWYAAGAGAEELWWFQKHGVWTASANPPSINSTYAARAVGDFDGDGFDDIFWTKAGTDKVHYGSPTGLSAVAYETDATTAPLAGDFDGDGRTDVVLDSTIWWGTQARTGPSGFSTITTSIVRPAASRFATGDFDADGCADILWANGSTGTMWFGKKGQRTFNAPISISNIPSGVLTPGDYDGDGRTDIHFYVVGGGTDTLSWARSTRGAFTPDTTVGSISGTYAGVSGDFDGDGASDIIWSGATDPLWSGKLR